MSHQLPLLPNFISKYIEKWATKRMPASDYKTTITRHRLYILPTRHGMAFFIILILILTGAINYANSLTFMLTFLLASICFLGMIYCHQNINNLNIIASPAKAVFAGQTARFPICIKSDKEQSYFSINLDSDDATTTRCNLLSHQKESSVFVDNTTTKRGILYLKKIKLSTEFPLGLFHAWSWLNLTSQCLVYPNPEKYAFNISYSGYANDINNQQIQGDDDFAGIRNHQKEDSPQHMAWKAIAKTGILQTKEFTKESGNDIYLSWFDLPGNTHTEKRLSIICYWIIEAEKLDILYGIKLPGLIIEPGSGLKHYHHCLKALALFEQ